MNTVLMILLLIVAVGLTAIITIVVMPSSPQQAPAGGTGHERLTREDRAARKRAAKEAREDARRLPYRHLESDGAFFVLDNAVWTGLTLPSTTDEMIPDEGLLATAQHQTRLLNAVAKNFDRRTDFHLRVVSREMDADRWADRVIASAPNPSEWYEGAMRRSATVMAASGESREITRVLLVRLGTLRKDDTTAPSAVGDVVTGVNDQRLTDAAIAHWRQKTEDLFTIASSTVRGVTRTDRDTIVWLIRKPLFGHLSIPAAPDLGRRAWGRGDFALIAGMSGSNHRNCLRLTQPSEDDEGIEQVSYTAAVVVTEQPAETGLRKDRAWVRHALSFGGSVDLTWRFSILPPRLMRDRVQKIYDNLNDEKKDMEKAGVEPDAHFLDQWARAREAVDNASGNDMYGMQSVARFILSAASRRELQENVNQFVAHMSQIDIEVYRPYQMQYRLIEEAMPGAGSTSAAFNRLTDPDMFGIGMPTAGSEIGDQVGVDKDGRTPLGWIGRPIGRTVRDNTPVHNDLSVGVARNGSGGVTFLGASGSGKSFAAMSSFLFESEAGRRCLAIDPKEDYAAMCYYLAFGTQVTMPGFHDEAARGTLGKPGSKFEPVWPEFWEDTEIIDLARAQVGVLCPFAIAANVEQGEVLAKDFLRACMNDDDWKQASRIVRLALNDMNSAYYDRVREYAQQHGVPEVDALTEVARPTLSEIAPLIRKRIDALREDDVPRPEIREHEEVLTHIESLARQSFSRLAFGTGGSRLSKRRVRRTVITLRGLPAPKEGSRSRWSESALVGSGALMLVLELANQMFTNDGDEQKIIYQDEAHILTAHEDGRAMVRKGIKMGRSTNTVTCLITQQGADLKKLEDEDADEPGANQFHEAFVFNQATASEARAALPLLHLDPHDDRNIAALDLPTGECIMRDADNRCARIEIEQFWMELRAACETNASLRTKRQSVPLSPNVYDWTWVDAVAVDTAAAQAEQEEGEYVAA